MKLSNKNVIHVKKDGCEYLQFKKLLEYEDVLNHAYSLGTNVTYRTEKPDKQPLEKEEYNKTINNYKVLCNGIGTDYINIVKVNQEHTKNVEVVEEKTNESLPDIHVEKYDGVDGLITNKKNLILSTTNADCILLLFFDPVKKVISNVHSGWKGTLQRISVEAVRKMKSEFNCNLEDIICCMCPSIRKCHFEVDKEIKDMFEKEFKDLDISNSKDIMEKQENKEKWNIDTILINRIILENEGLDSRNIIDSGLCSVCNSDLIHSFRVEKEGYGLETALIELK